MSNIELRKIITQEGFHLDAQRNEPSEREELFLRICRLAVQYPDSFIVISDEKSNSAITRLRVSEDELWELVIDVSLRDGISTRSIHIGKQVDYVDFDAYEIIYRLDVNTHHTGSIQAILNIWLSPFMQMGITKISGQESIISDSWAETAMSVAEVNDLLDRSVLVSPKVYVEHTTLSKFSLENPAVFDSWLKQ